MMSSKFLSEYVSKVLNETSFHGLQYLTGFKQRSLETLFWLSIWCLSASSAVSVISSNWNRFQQNPTVIGIDRNYREFKTTFPAGTFCFSKKYNESRIDAYIDRIQPYLSEKERNETAAFIRIVANATYEGMEQLQRFSQFPYIPQTGFYNIAVEVRNDLQGTFDCKEDNYSTIMTDVGLCFTCNSAIQDLFHDSRKKLRVDKLKDPWKVNFDLSTATMSLQGHEDDAKFFAHSPWEIADTRSLGLSVSRGKYHVAQYGALELISSPEVRTLQPHQRRCLFPEESILPVYAPSLCIKKCTAKLAKRLCGCTPYFYPPSDEIDECNITGLLCISKNRDLLISLWDNNTTSRVKCDCPPLCHKVSYFLVLEGKGTWLENSQFYWKIENFPGMQLQRKVLYGATELLVSFGGTAALFLGCSLLSGAELIYFFTLHLFWRIKNLKGNSKNKNIQRLKYQTFKVLQGNQMKKEYHKKKKYIYAIEVY